MVRDTLDCIVLTKAWLPCSVINYNTDNFNVIKTNNNLFNQTSGIIVYVNNKHQISDFTEIFIDKCNCLHFKVGNCDKYEIIILYRSPINNFNNVIYNFYRFT